MATYTGKSGVLKINDGSTLQAVAEIRSFTLDSTMDTIENTAMEAGAKYESIMTFSSLMILVFPIG